jgi:hypothetical protein
MVISAICAAHCFYTCKLLGFLELSIGLFAYLSIETTYILPSYIRISDMAVFTSCSTNLTWKPVALSST